MTTPLNDPPDQVLPAAEAPALPVPVRQPLGLPAGSVRALLAFTVLGLIWALMLLPEEKVAHIPLYLYYLMFLILGHFFAAHGYSIAGPTTGTSHPLYLPRGTLRTLLVLGFAAVLGYRYYEYRDVEHLFKLPQPTGTEPFYLPLLLVGAFFLGVIIGRFLHPAIARSPGALPWAQDLQAWLALVTMLLLGAEVIIQLVINPSLPEDRRLHLPHWEMFLAAIICFYFGVRS